MNQIFLLAWNHVERQSFLHWLLASMGPIYTLTIIPLGIAIFVGACLLLATQRRPAVLASYLVFLLIPLLLGVLGTIQGFINFFMVVAYNPVPPRPEGFAEGVATALSTTFVAVLLTFPSLCVLAVGLFLKTLKVSREKGDA